MKLTDALYVVCLTVVFVVMAITCGNDPGAQCTRACRGRVLHYTAGVGDVPTRCQCADEETP